MYNYVVVYVDTIIYEDITIEDANKYCSYVLKNEYDCPSCLGIKEERDWLDNYFAGEEFETIEEI